MKYSATFSVKWPMRKAWGGVKCLRENGAKYTAKHAADKVLRRFDSKWGATRFLCRTNDILTL